MEEMLSSLEQILTECTKEVQITPVLISIPAWEYIGNYIQ